MISERSEPLSRNCLPCKRLAYISFAQRDTQICASLAILCPPNGSFQDDEHVVQLSQSTRRRSSHASRDKLCSLPFYAPYCRFRRQWKSPVQLGKVNSQLNRMRTAPFTGKVVIVRSALVATATVTLVQNTRTHRLL